MDEEAILVAVPDDEVLFKKQYYPMRTVAEWFGVTLSQLRKWENEFDILQPKKNARGDRFFRPEDVKNLELIYHLIRRRKFTVAGAKQYLKENKTKLQNTVQLLDALNKFKQFLLELRAISE
ncbi:MerR family transcriptional regulator [Ilyomonas limi]|uniref:MerR family transcriptional regulator n=2 Tax=Ilyomonas limi TaxID=2575867 RepID=A0A4U3L0T4_9BACT|nr:MerR family transcriptional regulator [Ilyomonas limi]